jgi:protein-S-isoprenylcysteine O-methyltransferase Ste14
VGDKGLELTVPPLLVTALLAAAMAALAKFAPWLRFSFPGHYVLGILLGATGAGIALLGVGEFRRAGASVNPVRPDAVHRVVTGGIYRFSRNPMYLGFALALTGWALWLSNALAFVAIPALVAYLNRFQIGPEERLLLQQFGSDYGAYMDKVRRWVGRN